jgi:hypothetical protein
MRGTAIYRAAESAIRAPLRNHSPVLEPAPSYRKSSYSVRGRLKRKIRAAFDTDHREAIPLRLSKRVRPRRLVPSRMLGRTLTDEINFSAHCHWKTCDARMGAMYPTT